MHRRKTSRGFSAELAIPRAFLDERQGGPWQAFRLDVGQQDFDAEGRSYVSTTHAFFQKCRAHATRSCTIPQP